MDSWDEDNCRELYSILDIGMEASHEEIRRAYRKLALKWHPDKHLHDPAEAADMFQRLNAAYEILRQPAKRSQYDELLLHKMFMEDYLQRYCDLILTAQGLGLPLSPKKGEVLASSSSSSSSGGMYTSSIHHDGRSSREISEISIHSLIVLKL